MRPVGPAEYRHPLALPDPPEPRTAGERARAEITTEILDAARGCLATDGAPALSLRATAWDLGMASSALYRYFSSRDELLTRLMIDAYDSLGAAAEASEAAVDPNDLTWQRRNPATATPSPPVPVTGSTSPASPDPPAPRTKPPRIQ